MSCACECVNIEDGSCHQCIDDDVPRRTLNNEPENVVPDLASIFASFLASVRDVPRNDEAIKVIEFIADTVNIFRLSLQLIFMYP